jgi:small-conductance mechanosensitive channel
MCMEMIWRSTVRGRIRLAWVVLALLAVSSVSQAKVPPPPPVQEKVEQLLKLLNDPDVKALLAAKGTGSVDETSMGASAEDFQNWTDAIRTQLRAVVQAIPAVPGELSRARSTIMTEINGRRPAEILVFFAAFAAIGFGAEFIFLRLLDRARRRRLADQRHSTDPPKRHHEIGRSVFLALAPVVVFAIASIGTFLAFTWPPLLASLLLPMLFSLIAWRLVTRITAEALGTGSGQALGNEGRPRSIIPMDEARARFWSRRTAVFAGIFLTGWAAAGLMATLNFEPSVRAVIVYALGLGLLGVGLEAVWHRAGPEKTNRAQGVREWLLSAFLCLLWLFWVAGATIPLWIGIYALILPPIFRSARSVVKSFFTDASASGSVVFEVLAERAVRLVIIAVAAVWLAAVVRQRAAGMMADEDVARLIRGALGGVVILLAADLTWQVAKGLIDLRVEGAGRGGGNEAEQARSGRLMTLLPILRNFLAVLIAAVAILMALSQLGVAIGPLIAGAGIFGVAIGFGSQSLVRDVISGIFYMADDAFRVGEYIESGKYKGTVESFSLRSVRLRHGRGPIFTVPFGLLGAVQNGSRDWAIDKFIISVAYDTDLVLVKKLVKGIGAALLDDPELGPQIIETLKMKGVEKFGDYGIDVSFAMMTKPGQQSGIRRSAYVMIRQAFAENGIRFASPSVQVGGNDDRSASVAAATRDAMVRRKAAEAANEIGEI